MVLVVVRATLCNAASSRIACGELTWWTTPATADGYRVRVTCPGGAVFDRWVTLEEAEKDLIRSGLLAFED